MNHAETKRPVSRIARLFVACALVAIAGACRSPVSMSSAGGGTADFSIRFLVSGTNRDAPRADPDSARPRLILPTADTLTVTLSASDGAGDPIVSTSAISGTTASVRFGEVPFGSYEIRAEAFGGGAVRFRQVSTITVAATDVELTLNLLPTDAEVLETVTQYSLSVAELAPDASVSWGIPTGSGLLAADSMYVEGLVSDCHVFLQDEDGRLLGQATVNGRLVSSSLPKDRPSYITFYNGGTEATVSLSAFAGPAMLPVPAGTFQRDATVTNTSYVSAFSMGKYEVTRELYMAVMKSDPSEEAASSGMSDPAQNMSWYDAVEFCNRLSLMEGLEAAYTISDRVPATGNPISSATVIVDPGSDGYRLPTQMEWMWAAMGAPLAGWNGGTDTAGYQEVFSGSTGANAVGDYAWTSDNSTSKTHPVGGKLPNELGLYDMSGNAQEWCWDRTDGSGLAAGAMVDYQGLDSGSYRGSRGGCWTFPSTACPLSYPGDTGPAQDESHIGFRVVRGTLPTYTVNYSANGATSGTVPAGVTVVSGGSHTVTGNTGSLIGPLIVSTTHGVFATWNTQPGGNGTTYSPGSSIPVIDKDMTLYAQYTAIGAIGPGGGTVFFDAGTYDSGWRYMEITTANVSGGAAWGPSGEEVGGTRQGIGYGKENTDLFIAMYPSGSYAANACVDYRGGGLSDWFLPSYHEIHEYRLLSFNTLAIDGDYDGYWTSSEYDATGVNNYTTFGLENSSRGKTLALKVRAVRRF